MVQYYLLLPEILRFTQNDRSFALFVFNFFYLVKTENVPAAFELGIEKVLDDSLDLGADLLRGQAADLGIVMEAGAVGGKDIIALGGADAAHFIGGDAHADAGAADQNAPVVFAPDNSLRHLYGDIRIIDGILRIAAEVVISMARLR